MTEKQPDWIYSMRLNIDDRTTQEDLREMIQKYLPKESTYEINENTSDGYHTFKELYDHRITLFIALIKANPEITYRANNNDDGNFTIINYEEAQSLGLLGEKEPIDNISQLGKDLIKARTIKIESQQNKVNQVRCIRCGNVIPDNNPRLSNKDGESICMGCEFKKPEEIVHWYKDGDTIEAEFDGCLYYGELKGGFVLNPVKVQESPSEDNLVEKIDKTKSSDDIRYALEEAVDKINKIIEILNKHLLSK